MLQKNLHRLSSLLDYYKKNFFLVLQIHSRLMNINIWTFISMI